MGALASVPRSLPGVCFYYTKKAGRSQASRPYVFMYSKKRPESAFHSGLCIVHVLLYSTSGLRTVYVRRTYYSTVHVLHVLRTGNFAHKYLSPCRAHARARDHVHDNYHVRVHGPLQELSVCIPAIMIFLKGYNINPGFILSADMNFKDVNMSCARSDLRYHELFFLYYYHYLIPFLHMDAEIFSRKIQKSAPTYFNSYVLPQGRSRNRSLPPGGVRIYLYASTGRDA